MSPEKVDQRAMWVGAVVGVFVMDTVHGDPASGCILHRTYTKNGERVLKPFRRVEPLMCEQAVIAKVDAERAEHVEAKNTQDDARPAKEVRKECQAGEHVDSRNADRVTPAHANWIDRRCRPFEMPHRWVVVHGLLHLLV